MGHIYIGNPASFPTGATLPDDGDPRTASSVNVPFEALFDSAAFLKSMIAQMGEPIAQATTTTPVSWTAPANAASIFYEMCGGGGGGGGGQQGAVNADFSGVGGGGGGGAPIVRGRVDIVPGRTYQLFPGAGGGGGGGQPFNALSPPGFGGDGVQSFIKDTVTNAQIAFAVGGHGAYGSNLSNNDFVSPQKFAICPGGRCRRGGFTPTVAFFGNQGQTCTTGPGDGGDGIGAYADTYRALGFAGARNGMAQENANGGPGGNAGADDGTQRGGGPGGGGGGSLGVGGIGGDGGAGHAGGTGANGNTGTSILPTLGGGGGGGGAGGGGATAGNGGNGQAGATGCIRIWVAGVS